MKKAPDYLDINKKDKKLTNISPRDIKKHLIKWSLEAHKIDSSKSISYYYDLFNRKLISKYQEVKQGNDLFMEETIEV